MNDQRTQGTVLLAVGAMALFLSFSDLTLSYVRAGLRPLLGAAGLVLLALSLLAILGANRRHGGQGQGHDHGGGGRGPRIAWLLVLPVLVLLLIEPPALGSFAASKQSSLSLEDQNDVFPALAPATAGAVPMGLSEFTDRALFDKRHSLTGARVRVFGFVMPEKQQNGSYRLARFVMFCCAADAEVVEIAVRGDPTPRQPDQWLTIEGHWPAPPPGAALETVSDGAGGRLPVLVADKVTPTSPPRDRYEHTIYAI